MLECQRAAFDLGDGVHYLNCAYMAPMSRSVERAGLEGLARKRRPYQLQARHFFEESEQLRERFARVLGLADAERVALVPSVSYGMAIVARNTSLLPSQKVVVAHEQFPSNVYAWRRLCARHGARLEVVRAPIDGAGRAREWNARLVECIDASTALVALPHVHWADGTRFDLAAIAARARAVGAALVVDGTQSIGALPFDMAEIRPDALVCAGYKWLMGPYALGYAYLGPRFEHGEPLEDNWIARASSEDFRGLVQYRDDYQPGARRFDMGERSNLQSMPMALAALEQVLAWGPERIQRYCSELAREIVARAAALGFVAEDEAWRGAHLFGLRAPRGVEVGRVSAALQTREVHVSVRGDAIRVSPHVYNDSSDVDALVEALREGCARS